MFRTGLLILLLITAAACQQTPSYPKQEPPAGFLQNSANQSAGRTLFREHCVRCHGTFEEGRGPEAAHLIPQPPTFTNPRYASVDPGYLFWRIRQRENGGTLSLPGVDHAGLGSLSFGKTDMGTGRIHPRSGRGAALIENRRSCVNNDLAVHQEPDSLQALFIIP